MTHEFFDDQGVDAGFAAGTAADFAELQVDPAPQGTADWVQQHFAGTAVQIKGIAAAPQLMHSKYVLRDAATVAAAVWTGSANFTDDAWTLQENNILSIESAPVAAAYLVDFEATWAAGKIKGTGAGDGGSATVLEFLVSWDFAPGDGKAIAAALVVLGQGVQSRTVIAAMVLTSHELGVIGGLNTDLITALGTDTSATLNADLQRLREAVTGLT